MEFARPPAAGLDEHPLTRRARLRGGARTRGGLVGEARRESEGRGVGEARGRGVGEAEGEGVGEARGREGGRRLREAALGIRAKTACNFM